MIAVTIKDNDYRIHTVENFIIPQLELSIEGVQLSCYPCVDSHRPVDGNGH
jgi:hypothetical protein